MICSRCGKEQDLASGYIDYIANYADEGIGWTFMIVCLDCWKDFEAFWKRGKEK